jgi:hypothetical protein
MQFVTFFVTFLDKIRQIRIAVIPQRLKFSCISGRGGRNRTSGMFLFATIMPVQPAVQSLPPTLVYARDTSWKVSVSRQ